MGDAHSHHRVAASHLDRSSECRETQGFLGFAVDPEKRVEYAFGMAEGARSEVFGDLVDLLGADLDGLTDEALGALLVGLHRLRAVADARLAEGSARFDSCVAWARDGARSGPAWLTAHTGAPHGRVKGDITIGRDLRSMPATEASFADGRLSREQVVALIAARSGLEGPFALVEPILVDEVAGATAAAGQRFLRRWVAEVRERLALDGDDGPEPPADGDGSRLHLSSTFEGRWVLDATLSTEDGEVVANALDARVDAMFHDGQFHADDGLLPAERRAVALVELVARGTVGRDDDGTARPLVVGVIDLRPEAASSGPADPARGGVPGGLLAGRLPVDPGALAEAERAGVVDRATLERWVCEGTVQTIVIGPDHDELRLGRKVRVATRAQRRALRVRDGGCVFPGCSASPVHCQAHHIVEWEHGGPTDLDNLVLVCRWHHRVIHQQGFTVERVDGRVVVRRPDGTQVAGVRSVRCDHRRARPPPPAGRDPDEAHHRHLVRCRIAALANRATYAQSGLPPG